MRSKNKYSLFLVGVILLSIVFFMLNARYNNLFAAALICAHMVFYIAAASVSFFLGLLFLFASIRGAHKAPTIWFSLFFFCYAGSLCCALSGIAQMGEKLPHGMEQLFFLGMLLALLLLRGKSEKAYFASIVGGLACALAAAPLLLAESGAVWVCAEAEAVCQWLLAGCIILFAFSAPAGTTLCSKRLDCGLCILGAALISERVFPLAEAAAAGRPLEIAGFVLVCIMVSAAASVVLSLYRKLVRLEEQERFFNLQLKLQKEQYQRLLASVDKAARTRHDLRQHFIVLKAFVSRHDEEGLRRYLEQYGGAEEAHSAEFCKNQVVNALLRYYFLQAEKSNIRAEASLDLPEELGDISEIDLSVIMGNCLENALEACRRMREGKQYILVNARVLSSMLSITIDNSFEKTEEFAGEGIFLSQKRGQKGAGMGIASVREAVRRGGGSVTLGVMGNEFRASVLLPVKNKKSLV